MQRFFDSLDFYEYKDDPYLYWVMVLGQPIELESDDTELVTRVQVSYRNHLIFSKERTSKAFNIYLNKRPVTRSVQIKPNFYLSTAKSYYNTVTLEREKI